ncbi:alpha/beta fold hydrolase (plasmid) [Streptomyces sp. NBC_01591]|uniref:alpha/beta hydrolase n=1 Tax=Streptomyces sp. NBC_01591 TaxID=2975888 RepID=UPI002DDC3B8B|nr:alpha/beta hydrolase [Streptomyces sp. NBC_01591]WSD73846.1 alpha/beta fold hydrolase [Streptomyces sp. NBC_01591]
MNTSMRVNPNPNTRRRVVSVLLALSASAATLVVPGAAAAQESSGPTATVPPIRWGACPKAEPPYPDPSPKAQCATVKVPLDWSKPKGPEIGLFVARYRATDPARRIGVLMSNPGGPGAGGADDALYADDPIGGYAPAMLQRFDMIGFDPRGIGRSQNAGCDEAILDSIPARPRSAAEFERLRTLNGRLADSCLKQTGPLAAHMDGESVARDMDSIRAALGERRISFLGHSYGTFLGERYARLFPGNLRALALDSAMDPDRPNAERYLTDGSVTIDNTLKRLAAWCEKDMACALKGKDLTAVTDKLFARADAGTLRDPGPNGPTRTKVDADQLSDFLTFALGKGSQEETARQLAALHTGKGEVYWTPTGTDPVSRLVLCRDYDFRIRDYAQYQAIRKRVAKAAPHVRYNAQALDVILGCQGWTMPPKPRPALVKGDLPPVLLANATHDLATPLPGAQRMARSFPQASLFTMDVVGHWLYRRGGTEKAMRVIDTYLTSPKG